MPQSMSRTEALISSTLAKDCEKRVRLTAVVLLMCRRFWGRESHYGQKLSEKLRTEMPPGVPEKILRIRREPTNRRSFQVRMEHISDDERLCLLSALLNDPEWIAAV